MLAVRQLVRTVMTKNAGIITRAYGGGGHHHQTPNFNELPVPEGDWQEKHQQTQARYNAQLAGSFLLLVSIIAYIKQSNVVDFNFSPPKTYE